MIALWGILAGLLVYLELAYHFIGFGWSGFQPLYTLLLIIAWSGVGTMLVGVLRGKPKKICFYSLLWFPVIWTGAQLVYLRIFRQPLLWEAMFRGGGDALTNYWREALDGILGTLPFLALLLLPVVVLPFALKKCGWRLPDFSTLQVMRTVLLITAGTAGSFVVMGVGKSADAEYYEEYHEFYDPLTVARNMGILPTLQRDTANNVYNLLSSLWREVTPVSYAADLSVGNLAAGQPEEAAAGQLPETDGGATQPGEGSLTETDTQEPAETNIPVPQQFSIDFQLLHSLADNKSQTWLADYIESLPPVYSNAYTGLFEGYNLIYLTAEGFSTYAIDEELTPTLYRLANSGFVFDNYYVPLWQTSTSDGEYINCTALIPDGQFSMRKSADNDMAYTLPKFFSLEGVPSLAYHNNTLSYYDRHRSHPNLGYDFKACKLGKLSQSQWGDKIFPMEHPNAWPASDLEMMQGTIQEYLGLPRFHVYYMTVSGHMKYDFSGNSMSYKNREAVSGLQMSEGARAYIACNIELDKALEYMLEQLEAAGQLERTVICLSADHYPYGLSAEEYEELAGKPLSEGMDLYRNTLILWNAGMEGTPVHISKACGSMDIVPTLLNLFGFDYDARMYAGRDIFSNAEGLVIFNDRSFVTDAVIYKKGQDAVWLQDGQGNDIIPDELKDAYLETKKLEVKNRYQFSSYILRENYYSDVKQAVIPDNG